VLIQFVLEDNNDPFIEWQLSDFEMSYSTLKNNVTVMRGALTGMKMIDLKGKHNGILVHSN